MFVIVTIFILVVILLICINSTFTFKNYNLIIWRNNKVNIVTTIRYIFDGWTDQKQRQLFHSSITFLETEASAGRTTPSLTASGISRLFTNLPEIYGVGTQVGSLIEIDYITTVGSPAEFENFFVAVGIAVHRADPFVKPIKTIWQVLREKLRQ